MILADSAVRIDHSRGTVSAETDLLRRVLRDGDALLADIVLMQ